MASNAASFPASAERSTKRARGDGDSAMQTSSEGYLAAALGPIVHSGIMLARELVEVGSTSRTLRVRALEDSFWVSLCRQKWERAMRALPDGFVGPGGYRALYIQRSRSDDPGCQLQAPPLLSVDDLHLQIEIYTGHDGRCALVESLTGEQLADFLKTGQCRFTANVPILGCYVVPSIDPYLDIVEDDDPLPYELWEGCCDSGFFIQAVVNLFNLRTKKMCCLFRSYNSFSSVPSNEFRGEVDGEEVEISAFQLCPTWQTGLPLLSSAAVLWDRIIHFSFKHVSNLFEGSMAADLLPRASLSIEIIPTGATPGVKLPDGSIERTEHHITTRRDDPEGLGLFVEAADVRMVLMWRTGMTRHLWNDWNLEGETKIKDQKGSAEYQIVDGKDHGVTYLHLFGHLEWV